MAEMNSRERVIMTLKHKEADRVPIDFGSSRSTGINGVAYNDLKNYLGLNEDKLPQIFDVKQLLALPSQEFLDWAESDVVGLHRLTPSLGLRRDSWKVSTLPDDKGSQCLVPENFNPVTLEDGGLGVMSGDHVLAKRPAGGLYFDEIYAPLGDAHDIAELDKHSYPSISDEELEFLNKEAQDLYENTEYAISGTPGLSIFEKGLKDFGYEEWLIRIMSDKDFVRAYLDRLTEAYLVMLDRYLGAVGPYIQVIQANDDLGMQEGPLIPPRLYKEIFKPYHQEIFSFIKKKCPDIFIFLHSCGSIFDFIPDLIEVGVDILNPVQINANKMDPRTLKREFGQDVTFWGGGCNSQTTLAFGSIEEVAAEVEEMIGIFKEGGGFVFCPVHNIQAGVSPEKIVKLFETAKQKRIYHK